MFVVRIPEKGPFAWKGFYNELKRNMKTSYTFPCIFGLLGLQSKRLFMIVILSGESDYQVKFPTLIESLMNVIKC